MRTTTATLVVAGLAAFVAGARAQDAQSGPRGSIVFPAGDRVHGHMRAGETHALEVHLAKGDRYSLSVAAPGVNDLLLIRLTVIDPTGADVSYDAKVRHFADGKRVTVGPFRATQSGTYVVELLGDGAWEGDYAGQSKISGARRSTFHLPANGRAVKVAVAAGSTISLRGGHAPKIVMSLPESTPNDFAADDPLVATLRSGGLTSSGSGAFAFAAPGAHGAVIQVDKPKWTANDVAFPTLPAAASAEAPTNLTWVRGWTAPVTTTPLAPFTPGAMTAVDPAGDASGSASLFLGADVDIAMAKFAPKYDLTDDAATPPEPNPVVDPTAPNEPPPVVTDPAVPTDPTPTPPTNPNVPTTTKPPATVAPTLPLTILSDGSTFAGLAPGASGMYQAGALMTRSISTLLSGGSMFGTSTRFRWSPWADVDLPNGLSLLPSNALLRDITSMREVSGDPADPYLKRTAFVFVPGATSAMDLPANGAAGSITTTMRYFVDGHQVGTLLGANGSYEMRWTVSGSGSIGITHWTIEGTWSCTASLDARGVRIDQLEGTSGALLNPHRSVGNVVFSINGAETYTAGEVVETVSLKDFRGFGVNCDFYDIVGQVQNTLTIPSAGIVQTIVRDAMPGDRASRSKTISITATTHTPASAGSTTPDDPQSATGERVQTITVKSAF